MQMKNKFKQTMTALCAALILMGGFSVPAYAQGTAAEPPTEDATNDSNVVVEEPETPPLTPKGNATLVDDFGGNKQLITVTTKGGNYFYILIDRASEGEQTVHFLNQVDEALSLIHISPRRKRVFLFTTKSTTPELSFSTLWILL